jgi:hypothetical protein
MKTIKIHRWVSDPVTTPDIDTVQNKEKHPIRIINWPEYSYQPEVDFIIGWSERCLHLNYFVKEESIMALTGTDQGPVWKDSCVEFFVSPDANDFYYNFEFNCIGTCLLAFGNSRHEREYAPQEVLSGIKRISSLERKTFPDIKGNHAWELSIEIPAEAFFKHPGFRPGKGNMKGNFYKCGDGLSKVHYLTWNPVKTAQPDYHRPEFFGNLELT